MRYFVELAFKGTQYHGWQVQINALSVQQVFNKALSIVLRHTVETTGCGRTDTGVHARQLFAHFDTDSKYSPDNWLIALNSILPHDITVKRFYKVAPGAHARYDALSRTYEYYVNFTKDPFYYGLCTRLRYQPDFAIMNEAAAVLPSFTDFSSFSKSRTQVKTNYCIVEYAYWEQREDIWIFKIKANRFLRNMVRAIVGTLLEVGKYEITPQDFVTIIESGNRSKAGISVPAEGLYLCETLYPYPLY